MDERQKPKPVFWIGSSRRDLKALPAEVRRTMGYAVWLAQVGDKHPDAKPLKGFGAEEHHAKWFTSKTQNGNKA